MSEDEGTDPAVEDVPPEEDLEEEPSPETEGSPDDGPETSEDVQEVLDRVTGYDDELAREVNSIVETAQDLHGTANAQREELEDLRERIDEQAETIGDLRDRLDERERRLADRESDLEDANERVTELEGALKRKQADFQNYKKRAKKRHEQLKERATEDLVSRLVGVRDNLRRALEEETDDVETLREGLEMTVREFDRLLDDENVEEIDPEPGTDVDPQRHEVMMTVDSSRPEGTIEEVYRPGYEMAGKIIQEAQVTVSNGELESEDLEDAGRDDGTEAETGDVVDVGDGEEDPAETTEEGSDEADEEPAGDAEAIELGGEVTADSGEASADDGGSDGSGSDDGGSDGSGSDDGGSDGSESDVSDRTA